VLSALRTASFFFPSMGSNFLRDFRDFLPLLPTLLLLKDSRTTGGVFFHSPSEPAQRVKTSTPSSAVDCASVSYPPPPFLLFESRSLAITFSHGEESERAVLPRKRRVRVHAPLDSEESFSLLGRSWRILFPLPLSPFSFSKFGITPEYLRFRRTPSRPPR